MAERPTKSVTIRTEFLDKKPARMDCYQCHRSRAAYLLTYRMYVAPTGATLAMGTASYCPYCDPEKSALEEYLKAGGSNGGDLAHAKDDAVRWAKVALSDAERLPDDEHPLPCPQCEAARETVERWSP